jgi:UDP-3-O-[3-hydroxymyristoyl] glucosamine N-acyltransferase
MDYLQVQEDMIMYPWVSIGENTHIERGAVLGCQSLDITDGKHSEQTGLLFIGDNVFIGANSCIARGRSGAENTMIAHDVCIGPLVNIAHGCQIRCNATILGKAHLSGFVTVGENTVIGPNSSIRNRIVIGNNCIIGMGAVVTKHVPDNCIVVGNPAEILKRTNEKNGKVRESL